MRRVDPEREQIRRLATQAVSLGEIRLSIADCRACTELAAQRTQTVAGEFPIGAQLMLVGEGPGAHEDATGRPFVGKGGQLLDTLLHEAGLRREDVAVANVVKCRPPANRTPTRSEAMRCTGWLDRQLELVDPAVVVTLGTTALQWALGTGQRLADVHGRAMPWRGRTLVATYHPSAALRFGPRGAPMAALGADLVAAARLLVAT